MYKAYKEGELPKFESCRLSVIVTEGVDVKSLFAEYPGCEVSGIVPLRNNKVWISLIVPEGKEGDLINVLGERAEIESVERQPAKYLMGAK